MWLIWILLTLTLAGWLANTMLNEGDKTIFMPGALSAGHHQLADACDACHTDPLGGSEVLQETCVSCHGGERVKPFDSHPRAKFTDPRNADQLENINALLCVSCHTEHRPEITRKDGLTQPLDVCFHCHSNIGEERPSHKDMPFDSCKNSGCHNFHNNRALYTDFLVKHMDEPALLEKRRLPLREYGQLLDEIMEYPRDTYPVQPLSEQDIDAPESAALDAQASSDWLASSHAGAGVNCSACHVVPGRDGTEATWTDHPAEDGCQQCHALEIERFGMGKHGMRTAAGLSPMTPAAAQLPMSEDSAHRELTCNSCHPAHSFDIEQAAVDACLGCHADEHSLAYTQSPHYELFKKEMAGELETGSGVSCASCHMPRVNHDVNDWMSRIMVDHNQSNNLSPNSKMIRPACLHCHGLGFSIDALADQQLIDNNFRGQPSVHVESIELAKRDLERAQAEREKLEQP